MPVVTVYWGKRDQGEAEDRWENTGCKNDDNPHGQRVAHPTILLHPQAVLEGATQCFCTHKVRLKVAHN